MDDNATHPLKELEVVLNAGVYHLDSGEDSGTDSACECLRTATEILNRYFEALGFDDSGRAPVGFEEMECELMKRKGTK